MHGVRVFPLKINLMYTRHVGHGPLIGNSFFNY